MKSLKKIFLSVFLVGSIIIGSSCSSSPVIQSETQSEAETKTQTQANDSNGSTAKAQDDSGTKKLTVGFSNWSRSYEFYVEIEKGMQEVADRLGIELILQDPDGDLAEQTKQLENFISRKVDGIILVPIDSEAAGDEVVMVNNANIPIISLDIAVTGGGITLSHLESNNYLGGEIVAKYIAEQLEGKGKVALINNPTITSLIDREKGFMDVIKDYPDIEVVSVQSGESKREKGLEVAENILLKYPDLNAFFCVNDPMGLGALQAVRAKNLDTIIVGFAAESEALEEIKSGTQFKATLSQEPKKMGERAMEIMAEILEGKVVETFIPVDVGLITQENVDDYIK